MTQTCSCGSGEHPYDLLDARGIYCGKVCSKCEPVRRAEFRPDIFTDANYWADEAIEPED